MKNCSGESVRKIPWWCAGRMEPFCVGLEVMRKNWLDGLLPRNWPGTDIMNRTGKKDQAVSIGGVSCYVRSAFETVNGNRIFITVPEDLVKLQTVQLLRVNLVVLFAAIGISLAATVFLMLPEIYVHAG